MERRDERPRELRDTLERRRTVLRESLKRQTSQQSRVEEATDDGGEATTSFTTSNAETLFVSMKERRLKRKGQLPPLESRDSETLRPTLDPIEPLGSSPPPSSTHPPPTTHPPPITYPPPTTHPPPTATSQGGLGSMGLSATVRERLRSKLQKAQSERGLPPSPEPPPPERRLRSLREQPRVTRFDEPPLESREREEGETSLPPALSLSHGISSRWRMLAARRNEVVLKTAEQEAYDFFTAAVEDQTWPDGEDTTRDGEEGGGGGGGGEGGEEGRDEMDTSVLVEQEEGGEDDGRQSVPEEAPMIADQSEDLLQPGPPMYTPQREWLSREAQMTFVPSTLPVAAEQKTPGSLPPRYLEEEGLYVGERPKVRWTNQVAVENRFLRRADKGEGWFGEDGLLLCQPNPLKKIHTRPMLLQYEGTEHVEPRGARVETFNQRLINRGSEEEVYQLDIDLSSLQFTHHPLFSVEHVMAVQLQQAHDQLKRRTRNRMAGYYSEKLLALKRATADIRQTLQETDPTSPETGDLHSCLVQYKRDVKVVRQQSKNEEASNYNLLKTVLRTWHQLKELRETQGYSSTTAWLTVRRYPTDAVEDEAQLRRDLDEEVSELREECEEGRTERMAHYKEQLAEWKTYMRARRHAIRRAQRGQSQPVADQFTAEGSQRGQSQPGTDQSAAEGSQRGQSQPGTDQSAAEGSQSSLLDQGTVNITAPVPPERPRPIPPPAFNEGEVRQQLVEFYRTNWRSPGEPLLVPELHHNRAVTQQCPRSEQQRREEVGRTRMRVKVLFNNQEVSQTKDGTLNADFTVHFGEIFNIRIVQWPESIKFQVYETGLLSSSLLAEVYAPIPDPELTSATPTAVTGYQFSCNKTASCTHTAVGSGESHPSLPDAGILVTSGVLNVGVCWGVGEDGRVLCPPKFRQPVSFHSPHTDAVSCLGAAGIADLQEVKKWIEEAHLDPNDPRNMELFRLVQSIPSSAEEAQYFRLLDVDDEERFVTEEQFNNDRRFRLLQLRDQGHPGLKHKNVPLNAKIITESVWQEVQDYRPYSDYDLPFLFFGDFHSARKEEQNRFLLDVRERVLSRVRSGKGDLLLSDVVHSEFIPNISALKNTLVELISPKRPLKPKRRGRRKPKPQNVHVDKADIVVRVVRAFNIPTRTHHDVSHGRSRPFSATQHSSLSLPMGPLAASASFLPSSLAAPLSATAQAGEGRGEGLTTTGFQQEDLVSPYIEVAFGEATKRTTTACGPNPFWNEELTLPFHPPHDDFSPVNLQRVTDVLHISIFDEVIIDILQDDRQRATNVHHRIEKRWLGRFTLPFSTLHNRARVEGTFPLDVPVVLLGYEHFTSPLTTQTLTSDLTSSGHTHLQLFVALEPPLSVLPPIKDQFDSHEDPHMLQHASVWLRKLRESYPSRHYTATALDISGQHVFVTRFVRPQNPPPALLPDQNVNRTLHLMERLAHYVSLIPFLPDAITFSGACDIWTTSDQFLHMLGGDEEEHAVLLCNYFLHCGWRAWVVLGHAIPEGLTAYVLTENPHSGVGYWLWNPSTGKHFAQHEAYCPLTSIGCVISNQTVWANIQDYEDPSRIVFDLENSKHWRTLFPTDMQPLATVQQELQYSETDIGKVQELQERIERTVREHLMTLRSRFITRWNRHCTRKLYSLLQRFEENLSSPHLPEHSTELAEITAGYQLSGFPLHLRYSDIQHIVSTVESTGIHLCENEHVEYALAVYVHPYPNDVLSVWLYTASLIPK